MKTLTGITTILLALAVVLPVEGKNKNNAQTTGLSESEAASLIFMREEEKLARDVYLYMHELWGTRIFSNIAASEQKHMDAILGLLKKYQLPDPILSKGEFSNPELSALYDELITKGSTSQLAALSIGALIEEVDINDLVVAVNETERSDLLQVYNNLLRGSENHLRAFVRNMHKPYEAQLLDTQTLDSILSTESSQGGRRRGRN